MMMLSELVPGTGSIIQMADIKSIQIQRLETR